MANLSNINNKFLFTDGDFLKIGNLAPINNISGTESGISVTNGNCASITLDNSAASGKTFVIYSAVNGSLNFFDADAASGRLIIDSSGNSTFAGNIYLADGTQRNIIGPTNQSLGLFSRPNNASEGIIFSTDGGTTTEMFIQDGGRVNIGPVNSDLPSALNIVSINNYNETGTGGRDTGGIIIRGGTTGDQNNTGGIGFAFGTGTAGISGYQNGTDADRVGLKFFTHGSGTGSAAAALSMIIKSGGEVGIGTTSPQVPLQIGTHLATAPTDTGLCVSNRKSIRINDADGSYSFGVYIKQNYSGSSYLILGTRHNGADTDALFVKSGNVGIGTASPNQLLEVANSAGGATISISTDQQPGSQAAKKYMNLDFTGYNNDVMSRIQSWDESSSTGHGNLTFSTRNASTALLSQRMIIDYAGRVGIGTSDVEETLTIAKIDGGDGTIVGLRSDASFSQFEIATKNSQVDWGLQTIGARNMYFATNSTERMRIASDGQVQIRNQGGGGADLILYNTDTTIGLNQMIGRLGFYKSDASGSGVGVSSSIQVRSADAVGGGSYMTFNTDDNTTQEQERMRITSGGQLLVGVQSSQGASSRVSAKPLTTSGVCYETKTDSDGYYPMFFHNAAGVQKGYIFTNATSTSYNTSSDYRLKENVVGITGALDRVNQLRPSRFNFIGDADKTVDGFLAHEVQEIVPEAISGEKDAVDEKGNPDYQGIDQSKLVPLLVAAIQELKADNDSLKARIETLENN